MQGNFGKRTGKNGKTVWTCVVDAPPDPVAGKRRQRRLSAPTKRELQDHVTHMLHAAKSGAYVVPTGQTAREYLAEWLAGHQPNVRETTYRSYEPLIRVHILPALGNVPRRSWARATWTPSTPTGWPSGCRREPSATRTPSSARPFSGPGSLTL